MKAEWGVGACACAHVGKRGLVGSNVGMCGHGRENSAAGTRAGSQERGSGIPAQKLSVRAGGRRQAGLLRRAWVGRHVRAWPGMAGQAGWHARAGTGSGRTCSESTLSSSDILSRIAKSILNDCLIILLPVYTMVHSKRTLCQAVYYTHVYNNLYTWPIYGLYKVP